MKKILEDIKTFVAEVIGLIGGLFWAKSSNWEYEPIILIAISLAGIIIFVLIKLIPFNEERPIVELEMDYDKSFRSPQKVIPGKSPRNEEGYYLQEPDGVYFYEIEHFFKLIVRNNSIQNAYNIKIYTPKVGFLKFRNETNALEPLIINNSKVIKMQYTIAKGMTFAEAEKSLNIKLSEELRSVIMIVEYQNEQRKTYYSTFTPLNHNVLLKRKPDLKNYRLI
jgi:hypothetical protein